MLQKAPKKRISLDEALKHDFLNSFDIDDDLEDINDFIQEENNTVEKNNNIAKLDKFD